MIGRIVSIGATVSIIAIFASILFSDMITRWIKKRKKKKEVSQSKRPQQI